MNMTLDVIDFLRSLPEDRKKVIRKMIKLFGCRSLIIVRDEKI